MVKTRAKAKVAQQSSKAPKAGSKPNKLQVKPQKEARGTLKEKPPKQVSKTVTSSKKENKASVSKVKIQNKPNVSKTVTSSSKKEKASTSKVKPKNKPDKMISGMADEDSDGMDSENHALDVDQYDSMVEEVDTELDDDISLVASGLSAELVQSSVSRGPPAQILSPPAFPCTRCFKVLRSKHWYIKHTMAHRITDLNSRRPSANDLYPMVGNITKKALEEISMEYGEEKKKFVRGILLTAQEGTDDWEYFIDTISETFLNSVSMVTKLMPRNQYEEQLQTLNKLLNEKETYGTLLSTLRKLNEDVTVPQYVPGMVLFRLCSKIVDSLILHVFKQMQAREPKLQCSPPMSEMESKAFTIHMRKLFQLYYRKGLKQGSQLWLTRCACIRQSFITCNNFEYATVAAVLSDEAWEKGDEQLKLNDSVIKFFLSVEQIIDNLLIDNVPVNIDSVLNIIFDFANVDMLGIWHSLTNSYFSENESLVFMRDLVSLTISLSLRLEMGRKREEFATQKLQKYALRTDLKRN